MSQKSISFHLNSPPSGFLFQLSGALLPATYPYPLQFDDG